ncbi:MAG: thiazole biosynthesis adenylyltransferase ThiF, partial [Chloroflexi bacterium]|nr:thiazole biosynthesis adenylyltransferase ThiF [Chloroflexota bacterium]
MKRTELQRSDGGWLRADTPPAERNERMDALARYARQTILAEVGQAGQHKIACSAAAVVGCGALGTHIANHLVRAGVGRVRIIDRDFVELSNLQRQVLYDEEDAERGLPKAVAAAAGLRRINSTVQVEEVVADVNPDNAEKLLRDVQVVLDGTDNFETRFLINDVCLKLNVPWIYGGAIATYGMVMPIVPHVTPCFRCFVADMPPPGSAPTCDTVGVLGTVPAVIAAMQATEALKLLSGNEAKLNKDLVFVDLWAGQAQHLDLAKSDSPCPACDLGQYDFLAAREGQDTWRSV